jgi:hypothetical protein
MWRLVAFIRTDVSEEVIASIIRVERISELRTTLIVTGNWNTAFPRNVLQFLVTVNVALHSYRRENLKFAYLHDGDE